MWIVKFTVILAAVTLKGVDVYASQGECWEGSPQEYRGEISTTRSGLLCQRWDSNEPHSVQQVPSDGGHHNYCRSPDGDQMGTWCYTTNPDLRWEYCSILKCEDNSIVIWSSYFEEEANSFLEKAQADPLATKFLSTEQLSDSFYDSRVKCLETERSGNKLYFTDTKNNIFGKYNLETKRITRLMKGTTKYIYAISQDWETGNLYWTNTKEGCVMAGDKNLGTKVEIYCATAPTETRALTVIQSKRRIIFSTFKKISSKDRETEIIETDMGGNNPKVIFKYPDIKDIKGLATDDEKIYWIDNVGYACLVMSSNHDGSNRKEIYQKKFSALQDIAVHTDYVYVTDANKRFNYFDHTRYQVQAIRTDSTQIYTFTEEGIPHGIIIRTMKENQDLDENNTDMRCQNCEGICLPGVDNELSCRCAPGKSLQASTNRCLQNQVGDEYLVVLDKESDTFYRIALDGAESNYTYSITQAKEVSDVAIDLKTGDEYYYNPSTLKIFKMRPYIVLHNFVPESKDFVVNPITKDIFMIDMSNSIVWLSAGGHMRKTLVKGEEGASQKHKLALDNNLKYIYWTETLYDGNSGRLMRSRYNGNQVREVMSDFVNPRGISVSVETGKVFVIDKATSILHEIYKKGKKTSNKKYEIAELDLEPELSLSELTVYEGFAYIVDDKLSRVIRYKIGSDAPGAITNFGPKSIYQPGSIAVYSKAAYLKYLATFDNPCAKKTCKKACLAANKSVGRCIIK